jgi:hypothetical protein
MTLTEIASIDRNKAAARRAQATRALVESYRGLQPSGRPLPIRPHWSEEILARSGRRFAS